MRVSLSRVCAGSPDYYGGTCKYCVAADTCNNRGSCVPTSGACSCQTGFTGTNCASCKLNYWCVLGVFRTRLRSCS